MNPYDKAHELVKAIKDSTQYAEYLKVKTNVEANVQYKEMLEDFRTKQFEIQRAQLVGEKVDEEKMKAVEQLQHVLTANPAIQEYLMIEYKFAQLITDIQKIIGEGLDI